MTTQTPKSIAAFFGIFMFIIGLTLMAIAEHIDAVFGIGFLLFISSIFMAITAIIWKNSCDLDRFLRRNLDGDSK